MNEVQVQFSKYISNNEIRNCVLQLYAKTILLSHKTRQNNWNVCYRKGEKRFQLNCGNKYVLVAAAKYILVMCNREKVLSLGEDFVNNLLSKVEFQKEESTLAKVGLLTPKNFQELEQFPAEALWHNTFQFRIAYEDVLEFLPNLEESILNFAEWTTLDRPLLPASKTGHSKEFIDYLNQELEINIPQPKYVGMKFTGRYFKLGLKWGGMQNKSFLPLLKKYELSIGAKVETTPDDISVCSEGYRIVAMMRTIESPGEIKNSEIINEFPEYGIEPEGNRIYAAKCFVYELESHQQFEIKIQQGTCELHDEAIIEQINELLPDFDKAFNEWRRKQGDPTMQGADEKLKEYVDLLKSTKNLILTGAPGTGKTHLAKKIAEDMGCTTKEIGFVQFHPSYDYTDFVEGLRPVQDESGSGQIGFERKDGVFKEFCERALKNLQDSRKSIDVLQQEKSVNEIIEDFLNDAIEQKTQFETITKNIFFVDNLTDKKIFVSIPKNEKVKNLPIPIDDILKLINNNIQLNISKDVSEYFKRKWRMQQDSYIFSLTKKIQEIVRNNKNKQTDTVEQIQEKNFVFIIDEINRGEVAKIFGELFYSVDPGYRVTAKDIEEAKSEQKTITTIRTQYANLEIDGNAFDNALNIVDENNYGHFFVPENVYIIGTMNDIDRSVESMDFAFRRRFAWAEVRASDTMGMLDPGTDENGNPTGTGLESSDLAKEAKERMVNLNRAISEDFGPAYEIGASYFLKLNQHDGDFEKLWQYHIKGILEEYLRGHPEKTSLMEKFRAAYFSKKATIPEGKED